MRKLLSFIWANKAWWLVSLLLVVLLLGVMLWFSQTASIPVVYSTH